MKPMPTIEWEVHTRLEPVPGLGVYYWIMLPFGQFEENAAQHFNERKTLGVPVKLVKVVHVREVVEEVT